MSQPTLSEPQSNIPKVLHNPLPESETMSSSHSFMLKERRICLQKKIAEIGMQNPQKASLLSRNVIFFQGTQEEREILRQAGLEIPDIHHRERLLGGVLGEAEGKGLLASALKGAVRLLIDGNKKEVEQEAEKQFVKAQVELPNGELIEGQHEGGRILSKPKRSFKSMGTKKYHLLAYGQGKFLSKKVKYEGDFVDDLFHDLTGEATYFIERDTKYTGCFDEGKRSGHGVLEKYNQNSGKFYLYYRGTWKDDKQDTGFFFSPDGEKIAEIKDGIMQKQQSPKSQGSASSKPPASSPLSPPPTSKGKGEAKEGDTKHTTVAYHEAPPKKDVRTARSREFEPSSGASPPSRRSGGFSTMPHSSTRSHSSLKRQPSVEFDPTIPPEEACPLIEKKLSNPLQELPLDESIELLTTCIRYGNERAKKIEDKEAVIVIGNTGAGKSTAINSFAGCTMELVSPKTLGLKGIKKIVVVRSCENGGALDEIMPIGHTKESKTFMPQIETTLGGKITWCDCPGFLDRRGAEINIANAVNVKNAIIQAKGVKVLILINYHSLMADRGRGLSDMLKICSNLFGDSKNLEQHASSLLLGITQAPLDLDLEDLKEWIVEDTPPIMETLSKRIFLFDPLNRKMTGGWEREECLSQIQSLPPIEKHSDIFKTVLTDSDEKKLLEISEQMGSDIQSALKAKNFRLAASRLNHLQTLSIIEHITVERLLSQNFYLVGRHFQQTVDEFKEKCNFENFPTAQKLISELREAMEYFDAALEEVINIQRLTTYYEEAKKRRDQRMEKERIADEKLQKAQGQIKELIQLLEEQKQTTLEQLRNQEEKYSQMQKEMEERIESIQSSYTQMQEALQKEMDERLSKKEEELKIAKTLNQQSALKEISEEKEKLAAEYREKLEKAEQERKALLLEEEAQKAQREKEMAAEQKRLNERIEAIEAQKIQQSAQLKPPSTPDIAFGKAEWEKYFGDVGDEPPLPENIEQILNSPCPFWPGTIRETHMLVLVPKTLDKNPLTLNLLDTYVKNPREGENKTQYYNPGAVSYQIGDEETTPQSYWALITKRVLPNSREKSYEEQLAMIEHENKGMEIKRRDISYEIPKAIEMVVGIFTHYVRSGERLYPGAPDTSTRCKELIMNENNPVAVGVFDKQGLCLVAHSRNPAHNLGIAGVWKLPKRVDTTTPTPFGKSEWEKYFGDIGKEPPLPKNINEILKSPCPFWEGKKVEDTHMLVLIPESVNGNPMTINLLQKLIESPTGGGNSGSFKYPIPVDSEVEVQELKKRKVSRSYWTLMTKDVLPNSREKSYEEQLALVKGYQQRTEIPYEIPNSLEALVNIFMHYVRSGETLFPLFPDTHVLSKGQFQNTFTRSKEQFENTSLCMIYGSFMEPYPLMGYINEASDKEIGVAAVRKFPAQENLSFTPLGKGEW